MQKTKTKIITILLLSAMALALFPLVNASTGNIIINSTAATQPLPIAPVPAGGNISLYFGQVTFSGSQFYLLFSADGLSQVSPGDLRYTPLFNVAAVNDITAVFQIPADPAFPGQWTIGNGWVNGTIPQNIPGGTFYIKAFDGATTALAVTQGIPVIASISVTPIVGAAGTSLLIRGNAFPANSLVNITYFNPITATFATLNNLTQTNALGQFNYTVAAPDLKQAPIAGDTGLPTPSNIIEFQATLNATTPVVYRANYTEMQRGLLQFGKPTAGSVAGSVQNATGLFGNLTSFVSTVSVGVGDSLRIAGNWFYPGAMTVKFDSTDITPAGLTANGTGFFNTTATVPTSSLGVHNVTITDNGLVVFQVSVNVIQSIVLSPTSGPIGTTVTVNGYGFPSAGTPAGAVYNATITFGTSTTVRAWALTDANGAFTTTFVVPTSPGGINSVNATTNDTALTTAVKPFTVTSSFTVSPNSFYGNDSALQVKASGTGFDPTKSFFVTIDNIFSPFTNTTNGIAPSSSGILNFTFIGVGFQPGLHVVALYQAGSGTGANAPVANANFTVLADPASSSNAILNAINSTVNTIKTNVTQVQTTLAALNATVIAINGNTATLSTSIGTITTSINSMQTAVSGLSGTVTSISSGVATIQTNLGSVQTSIGSINSAIVSVAEGQATIQTSLGTITTSLTSINTIVTRIDGNVATVQTDLGTLTGTVTSVKDGVATIQTNLGTMQASIGTLQTDVTAVKTDVTSTKDNTASLSPLIIVAIVLALVAAIAAIASIVLMRRKIAG